VRCTPVLLSFVGELIHGWMDCWTGLLERLRAYYKKHDASRSIENWASVGTQTNFHAVPMTLVYLDLDPNERDAIAEEFVNPVVKEWSGRSDLTLNAFYGTSRMPVCLFVCWLVVVFSTIGGICAMFNTNFGYRFVLVTAYWLLIMARPSYKLTDKLFAYVLEKFDERIESIN
jgi:hypothetical protein